MRVRTVSLVLVLLQLGTHVLAQGPRTNLGTKPPVPSSLPQAAIDAEKMDLADVVKQVSRNVGEMYDGALADFYCKATFVNSSSAKFTKVSVVTGRSIRFRPGTEPELNWQPFLLMLQRVFGPENVRSFDFTRMDGNSFQGRPALGVRFMRKAGPEKPGAKPGGKITGNAWIDTTTLRVIHFEETTSPIPPDAVETSAILDYDNVDIGGQQFWLPTKNLYGYHSIPSAKSGRVSYETTTTFSDCQKFSVSVEIKIPK